MWGFPGAAEASATYSPRHLSHAFRNYLSVRTYFLLGNLMEVSMGSSQTMKVCNAAKAGKGLEKEAAKRERAFEHKVGRDKRKGADRVEERAEAANGKGPVADD